MKCFKQFFFLLSVARSSLNFELKFSGFGFLVFFWFFKIIFICVDEGMDDLALEVQVAVSSILILRSEPRSLIRAVSSLRHWALLPHFTSSKTHEFSILPFSFQVVLFCLFVCYFLRQGLTVPLFWNSPCNSCWPLTHRDPTAIFHILIRILILYESMLDFRRAWMCFIVKSVWQEVSLTGTVTFTGRTLLPQPVSTLKMSCICCCYIVFF